MHDDDSHVVVLYWGSARKKSCWATGDANRLYKFLCFTTPVFYPMCKVCSARCIHVSPNLSNKSRSTVTATAAG